MPRNAAERLLICHPARPDGVLTRVAVSVGRSGGGWRFSYRLAGDLDRLRVPPPHPPAPADGLWRHTCCEAFVAVAGAPAYREFNFSPSGEWAAYAFTSPRRRDETFRAPGAPRLAWRRDADAFELVVELDAACLPVGDPVDIGLSVVAEDVDGGLAYWALRHPSPQPDFHHREAFALHLARPSESPA